MSDQMVTHYVPSFTQPQPRRAQTAVCGQAVYAREHSSEPSCDKCQRWIADDEKDAAALAKKWDDEAAAARTAIGGR